MKNYKSLLVVAVMIGLSLGVCSCKYEYDPDQIYTKHKNACEFSIRSIENASPMMVAGEFLYNDGVCKCKENECSVGEVCYEKIDGEIICVDYMCNDGDKKCVENDGLSFAYKCEGYKWKPDGFCKSGQCDEGGFECLSNVAGMADDDGMYTATPAVSEDKEVVNPCTSICIPTEANEGGRTSFFYIPCEGDVLNADSYKLCEFECDESGCIDCERDVCSGDNLIVCNDGVPSGKECDYGCIDGKCRQKTQDNRECDDNQRKCEGSQVMVCMNGKWEKEGAPCSKRCFMGNCVECIKDGNMTCSMDNIMVCRDGKWLDEQDCGSYGCFDDENGAHCGECLNDDVQCVDDKVIKRCENGKWGKGEECDNGCIIDDTGKGMCAECGDGKVWRDGECREVGTSDNGCNEGDRKCSGSDSYICKDRQWKVGNCKHGCYDLNGTPGCNCDKEGDHLSLKCTLAEDDGEGVLMKCIDGEWRHKGEDNQWDGTSITMISGEEHCVCKKDGVVSSVSSPKEYGEMCKLCVNDSNGIGFVYPDGLCAGAVSCTEKGDGCGECKNGVKQCNKDGYIEICDEGRWMDYKEFIKLNCQEGMACVLNDGSGFKNYCSGDIIEECLKVGDNDKYKYEYNARVCQPGDMCENGKCEAELSELECQDNARQCVYKFDEENGMVAVIRTCTNNRWEITLSGDSSEGNNKDVNQCYKCPVKNYYNPTDQANHNKVTFYIVDGKSVYCESIMVLTNDGLEEKVYEFECSSGMLRSTECSAPMVCHENKCQQQYGTEPQPQDPIG